MESDWNIEGIADEVMNSMKEDDADIGDVDYYVKRICYWSIFSRKPEDAVIVSEKVKQQVEDKYEDIV